MPSHYFVPPALDQIKPVANAKPQVGAGMPAGGKQEAPPPQPVPMAGKAQPAPQPAGKGGGGDRQQMPISSDPLFRPPLAYRTRQGTRGLLKPGSAPGSAFDFFKAFNDLGPPF